MDKFLIWLKSKNLTAHSIAGVLLFLASTIVFDAEVRNLILEFFAAHPKIGTTIVTLAGIYFRYSHSSSTEGTLIKANQIIDKEIATSARQTN